MKTLLAALVAAVLLSACAPGVHRVSDLEWNGGQELGSNEPPVVARPGFPVVGRPVPLPPGDRPEPPAGPPPAPEPPADPYAGCRIKEMPPSSANERIIKCPGQPAIVIKRP